MKKITALLSLIIMLIMPSCRSAATEKATEMPEATRSVAISMPLRDSKPVNAQGARKDIPRATAFRMSGDYADKVAVTLDSQGNLIYFPAPTDITPESAPVGLADGWWLNRQGVGINSVFTRYTFAEYAALTSVPTPEQLKAAIIPGARVTEFIQLPYSINNSQANIPAINDFLLKAAK